MTWAIALEHRSLKSPAVLRDVKPTIERLRAVLGLGGLAEVLGVDAGNLSRFVSGKRGLPAETARRAIDLDHVLTRAAQIFDDAVIIDWLTGSEPRLNHARPIDVLAISGAGPLIEALDGIATWGYA